MDTTDVRSPEATPASAALLASSNTNSSNNISAAPTQIMAEIVDKVLEASLAASTHGDPPLCQFVVGEARNPKRIGNLLRHLTKFAPLGVEWAHLRRIKANSRDKTYRTHSLILLRAASDEEIINLGPIHTTSTPNHPTTDSPAAGIPPTPIPAIDNQCIQQSKLIETPTQELSPEHLEVEFGFHICGSLVGIPALEPVRKEQAVSWNARFWPMSLPAKPRNRMWKEPDPLPQDEASMSIHRRAMQRVREVANFALCAGDRHNAAVLVNPVTGEIVAAEGDGTKTYRNSIKHAAIRCVGSCGELNMIMRDKQEQMLQELDVEFGIEDRAGAAIEEQQRQETGESNESSNEDGCVVKSNDRASSLSPQPKKKPRITNASGTEEGDDTRSPIYSEARRARRQQHIDEYPVQYLCTGLDVYMLQEPCTMCAMALVHSRIRHVYFDKPNVELGGVMSVHRLQAIPELNHHFRAFRGFLPENQD